MGSSNENSAYGPVRNPVDTERVPGGSSGGSAAAVAANLAVATLGTDTGGSIRQPASFCGVVGVLPTYGRVSRYGLIAFASSLDRVGPFAGNVRDAATLLGVIAGHDPKDATSSPAPVPDYAAESDKPVEGLRIGVPAEYFGEGLDPEVRAAIEKGIAALKAAGCTVKPVSLPHTQIRDSDLLSGGDGGGQRQPGALRRRALRLPLAGVGDAVGHVPALARRGIWRRGEAAHSARNLRAVSAGYYDAYYLKAQQVRRLLAEEFLRAFAEVDAIVTPTAPMPAFKLGEKTGDPLAMYLADIYTVTASLAGICGVTVPCGTTKAGLPVGMQVLAAHLERGHGLPRGAGGGGSAELGVNRHARSAEAWGVLRLRCEQYFRSGVVARIGARRRKVHTVVLGRCEARAATRRPAIQPERRPGETELKIRAAARGWPGERVDHRRCARRHRPQLRGPARDPAQRRSARRHHPRGSTGCGSADRGCWSIA